MSEGPRPASKTRAVVETVLAILILAGFVWLVAFVAKRTPKEDRNVVKCPACGAELELKKKE